jgi:uncharacterized protein (UPF0332 family)
MNGQDFLAFASKIAVLHSQPAAIRSAISRAYYGAFHSAVQLLHELSLKTEARHGSVWMDFMTPPQIESQAIGNHLRELHAYRVAADYQLGRVDVEETQLAMICVETAEHVVSLVALLQEMLQQDKARDEFIQAILKRRQLTGRR